MTLFLRAASTCRGAPPSSRAHPSARSRPLGGRCPSGGPFLGMTLPPPCVPRGPRRCTPPLCVPLAKRALSGALGSPLCPSSQGDSSPRERPARGRVTPSAGGAPGREAAIVPPQARGGGAEAATAVGLLGVRTPSLGTWLSLRPTFPAWPRAPPPSRSSGN